VALYFNVRIGVRGDAEIAPRGALVTSRAATLKIFLPYKKAEGGAGEAAKKMKGNGLVCSALQSFKSSSQSPFKN